MLVCLMWGLDFFLLRRMLQVRFNLDRFLTMAGLFCSLFYLPWCGVFLICSMCFFNCEISVTQRGHNRLWHCMILNSLSSKAEADVFLPVYHLQEQQPQFCSVLPFIHSLGSWASLENLDGIPAHSFRNPAFSNTSTSSSAFKNQNCVKDLLEDFIV